MTIERALFLLLDWFEVTSGNEPLAGDLLEEFHSGRSRSWLFRQVVVAVLQSVARQVSRNKLMSLRAIATGLLVVVPLTALIRRVASFSWDSGPFQFWILSCCAFAIAGAVIGQRFPSHRAAMVAAFTLYALAAKVSLVGFNALQFSSPSHPFRSLVLAAATVAAPLCTVAGGLLLNPDVIRPMLKGHVESWRRRGVRRDST